MNSTDVVKAFEVLTLIEEESSTNSKKELLESNKENQVLRNLLYLAYSPDLQYNIKKLPSTNPTQEPTTLHKFSKFLTLLTNLKNRTISGNRAIEDVKAFLEGLNAEEDKWYTRVLKKDLRVGMNVKTINSVIPNLVPIYEVMLASKIELSELQARNPKALKNLPEQFLIQPKLDGVRLNIHVHEDGFVQLRTRNGKIVTGYEGLEKEASLLPRGYVYDGEIIAPEFLEVLEKNQNSLEVNVDRSHFSEVASHVFSHEAKKVGVFVAFDLVPMEEWNLKEPTQTYEVRFEHLEEIIHTTDMEFITLVDTYEDILQKSIEQDLDLVPTVFTKYMRLGYEGLMIKDISARYQFKRTKSLLKVKTMDTLDLTVTAIFPGTGKYENSLGGVKVAYKNGLTGVGSGFTDEEREYYWNNPNEIIGKTIEVSYQAETSNKEGIFSLSFPIFKGVRKDK